MEKVQAASGECPHCICRLEISDVKFRFRRTQVTFVCPNCAIVFGDQCDSGKQGDTDSPSIPVGTILARLGETLRMMEALNARVKYVVTFVVAGVIIAAFLRHSAHVYAGFSREEIRTGALITCSVVFLALMLWRRNSSLR
jgi:hypothetical protein